MPQDGNDYSGFHLDTFPFKHWEIDNSGFLRFIAPIAKEGDLTYCTDAGTVYQEFVPGSTLTRSANTFKTKPHTLLHPPEKVTPKNARKYERGLTGNQWIYDGSFLWLTGTATDYELIESIVNKKTPELSSAYDALVRCDHEGVIQPVKGKLYQADRLGNHLAAVPKGNAGSTVNYRLDSATGTDNDVLSKWQQSIVHYRFDEKTLSDPPEQFLDLIRVSETKHFDMTPATAKDPVITAITEPQTEQNYGTTQDTKKMAQIIINDRIFTVEGDDANQLRDAVATLTGTSKTLVTNLETAQNEVTALRADKATLEATVTKNDAELVATKAKLTETESATLQSKADSGDAVESLINDRIAVWTEIAPYFTRMDAAFTPDYKLKPIEVKYLYLQDAAKSPGYEEIKTDLASMTDLEDPLAEARVKAYYGVLKPKSTEVVSHADSVLDRLKTATRQSLIPGLEYTRTDSATDSATDPRNKLTRQIEARGRKATA